MAKKLSNTPVSMPQGGVYDYNNDNLSITEQDSDQDAPGRITERGFHARADIREGVNGCKPIDSTYENYSDPQVNVPRSDLPSPPIRGMTPNHSGVKTPAPEQLALDRYPHRRY